MTPNSSSFGELELEDLAELPAPRQSEVPVHPDEVVEVKNRRRACPVVRDRGVRLLEMHDVGITRQIRDAQAKVGFGELAAGPA